VIVSGVERQSLSAQLPDYGPYTVSETAGGLRIEVPDETYVDTVLAALRKSGGNLVSVQPIRQSLEELFVGSNERSIDANPTNGRWWMVQVQPTNVPVSRLTRIPLTAVSG